MRPKMRPTPLYAALEIFPLKAQCGLLCGRIIAAAGSAGVVATLETISERDDPFVPYQPTRLSDTRNGNY